MTGICESKTTKKVEPIKGSKMNSSLFIFPSRQIKRVERTFNVFDNLTQFDSIRFVENVDDACAMRDTIVIVRIVLTATAQRRTSLVR